MVIYGGAKYSENEQKARERAEERVCMCVSAVRSHALYSYMQTFVAKIEKRWNEAKIVFRQMSNENRLDRLQISNGLYIRI